MTKKEQFKVLETHYQGCLKYWLEQGEDAIVAMMYALEDIKRIRSNPFSLKYEPIPPEIIQEVVGKYSKSITKVIQSTYVGKLNSDDDDHIRRCVICGKPMKEGYYLGGEYACSDDCTLALYNGDEKQMYIDLHHADEDGGECYWIAWESYYL